MGRRQTIDREQVLTAAEQIVLSKGAAALTIDAVAKAAKITKGGVQSCFGDKEALVSAMLSRWVSAYNGQVASLVGETPDMRQRGLAHTEITLGKDADVQERSALLLVALLQ